MQLIAVPVHPPDNPYVDAVQAMRAAVDVAEAWAGRRQVEFDPEPFRFLLALLETNSQQSFQDSQRIATGELEDARREDEEP